MALKAAKYVLGLLIALQFGPQCFAQNTIFAKFDSFACQGAGDGNFPNSSAISSVGLGGTNTFDIGSTGGASAGQTAFADIKLVKTLDDCTPLLFKALARGTVLNNVTISIINPATANTPATHLLDILLQAVVITSDQFAEAVGGKPSEVVTLGWRKITITHVPSNTQFTWDRATNSSF
jgi:type VI protein secretion system component Hcp